MRSILHHKISFFLFGLVFLLSYSPILAATDVLQNSGFEDGNGTGGGSTITNWTLFGSTNGAATAFAERDGSGNHRTESFALKLGSFGGPAFEFSIAYQEITSGIAVGDTVTFQAYGKHTSGDAAANLLLKIEFRDSNSGFISQVQSADFANTSSYTLGTISGTVPSGARKVVLVIVHEMNGVGFAEYFVDDVSATLQKQSPNTTGELCTFPVNASFEDTCSTGSCANSEEIMPGWTRFPFGSTFVNQKDSTSLTYLALEGSHATELNIPVGKFAGVFQGIGEVRPGAMVNFSAFARTDNMSSGTFGQLKVEFKDKDDNTLAEFLSDKITSSNAAGDYKKFSASGTAPEGTTFAALVLVGDAGPGGGGDIVFDAACATFNNGPAAPIKITGDVFDTTTGKLIANTRVELLDATGRVISTNTNNPYAFTIRGGEPHQLRGYAQGYTFPSRLNAPILFEGSPIGDHGEIFTHFGDSKVSLPMDPGYPLTVKKEVNKKQASRGDLLVYKISVKNNSTFPVSDVLLIDELPDEFKYRAGTSQLDGQKIQDPTQNSPLTYSFGTITGSDELVLSYVALVGSKAELGRQYITPAVARSLSLGWQLSNESRAGITVTGDPIFDLGTIVGKVFNDLNANGVQDLGEEGIPDIRLATEEGTIIYTDSYGRYHIPGVKPGRHVIKIDRHSLPPGTEILSEESYLVKITDGLFSKVNFSVRLPYKLEPSSNYKDKLEVHVTQIYDKFIPKLDVSIDQEEIEVLADKIVKPVYFYINGNYLTAVSGWKIEIRDDRDIIIKVIGLTGISSVPPRVQWDGRREDGQLLEEDRTYSYQLMVTDGQNEDWTIRKYFKVTSKSSEPQLIRRVPFVQLEENEKPIQTIPIQNRNSVMVRGHAQPGTTVKIAGHEVYVREDGTFEKEILLPTGMQLVQVTSTDANGKNLTSIKEINVRDDYFFMVGYAEGELGTRDVSSHLDQITEDDQFEDGFYQNGRIAYYLKAKIKGRYLITSSLDTERSNHLKLFTNIDPDRYYPVYGDSSSISYDATDTKNNFYILAELDKSYVKWGSFETGLTDLDLATFNRTLSGAKGHIERTRTTSYGDPSGAVTAFFAEAQAQPDHNEFIGTGGSLYYLKNRSVIEGSEKVQMITRDKVTGRIISQQDLIEGMDYEIDYLQGRIILTKPLSSFSNAGSIISSSILDGNTALLVVDYEFQPNAPLENPTFGGRVYQHITNNIRLGGTYIEEDREGPDYKLLAGDILYKMGRNTKLTAEYAQSRSDQSSTNISLDGGITFEKRNPIPFTTINGSTGPINVTLEEFQRLTLFSPERYLNLQADPRDAYSLKFQTGLWERLRLKSYYTYINPGFSNTSSLFEEGTEKIGGEISYRLGQNTFVNIKHDTQKLLDEPSETVGLVSPLSTSSVDLLSSLVSGGEETHTSTVQITHDIEKWGLIGEYRHRKTDGLTVSSFFPSVTADQLTRAGISDPVSAFFPNIDSEDIIAGRITYRWSESFIPFIEQQISLNEEDNHQTTIGTDLKINSKIWLQAQETLGSQGNSTLLGLQAQTSEKSRIYINQILGNDDSFGKASKTTFGSHTQVDEKSSFTTEKQYTTYRKGQLESSLFGYEQRLQKDWALGSTYERIDSDQGFGRDAVSGTLSYSKWNFLTASTKLEVRQDEIENSSELRQYLTQNLAKWQTTEDLQVLGRFNYGFTEDRRSNDNLAEFYEATTGFAYRPVRFDRLNLLGKYTYLNDDDPNGQSDIGLDILERSHMASIEGAYDLTRLFQVVEKYAYKLGEVSVDGSDFSAVKTHLWINRINFHITRKWDLAGEFRIRKETETDDEKSGFLVEVDREMIDHIRLGAGYNFTDFSDDLRTGSDDDAKGFFVRLSGKF